MKKQNVAIIIGIFLFSFIIRFWNLSAMGRTWDENFYVEQGYTMIELAKSGDFTNFYWIKDPDEPILAKYFYGLAGHLDFVRYTVNHVPQFSYDLFYSRLLSVFFGCMSVILTVLIGLEYFSPFIAITAGIIFSLFPSFIGLTQRVTIESILVFFFTASVYMWIKFVEHPTFKKIYFFGVLLGLSCIVKFSNVLLIPLCFVIYLIWKRAQKEKENVKHFTKQTVYSFIAGFITFILIWPMPWLHLGYMIQREYAFRFVHQSSPWEWFFGMPIHVPWFYYIVHFLIRTPFFLLILGFFGFKAISDKRDEGKKWMYSILLTWFFLPFLQSFYHFRMQGIRYIIEVFVPFSFIAAFGLEYVIKKISSTNTLKVLGISLTTIYLLTIIIRISPYYLDYFNILVGGAKEVYEKNLFDFGWWGEGEKEGGMYIITHTHKRAHIGYLLDPFASLPLSTDLIYSSFQKNNQYDYVITNFFEYQKIGYNNNEEKTDYQIIQNNYKLVYTVLADGAELVHVYKAK